MKKYFLSLAAIVILFTQCSKTDSNGLAPSNANNLNIQSVGASAKDFLTATKYTNINVEIQFMPGFAPDATAINNLTSFLNSFINKPAGINVTQKQIVASGKSVITLDEIAVVEKNNRTAYTKDNTLAVHILYTDAAYTTANVLGIAYRNTSLVIFGPTVTKNSGGANQTTRTKLETTVLHHEFGHLLGLTDLGSAMVTPHKDAQNGSHCNNNNCLMYFTTQTTVMGGILLSGPIPVLDDNCKADLKANGGK